MQNRHERAQFVGEKRKGGSGSDKRSHVHSIVKGQEYDVVIQELGHNGDGIVHIEEYTIFVPNTEVGEEVKIKIKNVKETIAFADRI